MSIRLKTQGLCSRYCKYIVPLAVFAVALIPRVAELTYFISVDEPAWVNRSARFMLDLLAGDLIDTMHIRVLDGGGPGIMTMWFGSLGLVVNYLAGGELTANGLVPFLEHYKQPINDPGILPMARIATIVLAAAIAPALYLGLKGWLGDRIALLGALFVAFDPFFMAHSRVLQHDALVTSFVALSLMWTLSALWHQYSNVKIILSGITFPLALLSKLMGGFLGPYYLIVVVLTYFWSPVSKSWGRRKARMRLMAAVLIWTVTVLVGFVVFAPGIWAAPPLLFEALFDRGVGMAERGHAQFFLGTISYDPGPLFYPVVLLFRTTPITLVGFLLSFLALKGKEKAWRHFILLTLLFIVVYTLLLTATPKKQDRYLLPVFPWVDMLAAIGWLTLFRYLGSAWGRLRETARVVLPAGLVLLQLWCPLSDYPYYFGYYNTLLGGTVGAAKVMVVGWGEGLDEVGRYLDQKPDADELVVSAVPAIGIRPYFSGHVLDFYTEYSGLWADYVVTYVNQFQRNFPSEDMLQRFRDLEIEHVITRHGQPYAYIYKGFRHSPFEGPTSENATDVDFGGLFRLAGFDDMSTAAETGQLQVRLYWEALGSTETDYTWSLRLVDQAGHQWAQTDVRPMGGALPTALWRPGAIVVSDNQTMELPRGMPPGEYELFLQVYSLEDMKVLPVSDDTGRSTGTTAYLGTIHVPKQAPPNSGEALEVQRQVNQDMTSALRLVGHDRIEAEANPGQDLPVTLYWQAVDDVDRSYYVRLSLLDESGRIAVQEKTEPHSGKYATDLWTSGEVVQDRHSLPIPGDLDTGVYEVQLSLRDPDTGLDVSPEVTLGQVEIEGRPRHFEIPPDVQFTQEVDFEDDIRLLGFDLSTTTPSGGDTLEVVLYWQALHSVSDSYQVFAHLLGQDLTICGQHDSIPAQGALATDTWLEGEVISDVHPIVLDAETPTGDYGLAIGLYEPDSGRRLQVTRPGSAAGQDSVLAESPIHVQR